MHRCHCAAIVDLDPVWCLQRSAMMPFLGRTVAALVKAAFPHVPGNALIPVWVSQRLRDADVQVREAAAESMGKVVPWTPWPIQ